MADKIGKCEWITKQVVKHAKSGLSIKEIFGILHDNHDYQKMPNSLQTFRKYYYPDFLKSRGEQVSAVGNVMIQNALEGDFKAGELYLTTHAEAWQKKTALEISEVDDVDEERTELNSLLSALGLNTEENEDE